jgi:hypothetical protein
VSHGANISPVSYDEKALFLGDSITHAAYVDFPSLSYVNVISKRRNYFTVNQAIGGAVFSESHLEHLPDLDFDNIFIAYGTNDWKKSTREEFMFNIKAFFEQLYENYNGSKIYVITPIWRLEEEDGTKPTTNWTLLEHRDFIKKIALQYENVTVIDGYDLVPHDTELFSDKRLHPNDDGFKYYAENLIKSIKNAK